MNPEFVPRGENLIWAEGPSLALTTTDPAAVAQAASGTPIYRTMLNDLASRIGGYRLSEWGASMLSVTLFFLIPSVLYGQGTTGTILGTVIDKSGAVIAEAVDVAGQHLYAQQLRRGARQDRSSDQRHPPVEGQLF